MGQGRELPTTLTNEQVARRMVRIDRDPREGYVQALSEELSQTVFGQPAAMKSLARSVARFESGLSDPGRPLSVLFFLGPTGVGKTESAYALAEHLFQDRNSEQLKLINCSEFSERHTSLRLTGAPPSYVGYNDPPLITPDFLLNRNIILFDEVEKAHPQFHRTLLSIMDKANLKVKVKGQEENLNFSRSFIILTSNIGSDRLIDAQQGRQQIGFGREDRQDWDNQSIGVSALKEHFRFMPEFLSRIDEVIVFGGLGEREYGEIFWKFLREINNNLHERNPNAPRITTTVECRDWLLHKIDYSQGARGIRHEIDKHILEPASDLIMDGVVTKGATLVATVLDGQMSFCTDRINDVQRDVMLGIMTEGAEVYQGGKGTKVRRLGETMPQAYP